MCSANETDHAREAPRIAASRMNAHKMTTVTQLSFWKFCSVFKPSLVKSMQIICRFGDTRLDAAVMNLLQAPAPRTRWLVLLWLLFIAVSAGVPQLQQQLGVPDDAIVAGELAAAVLLIV
jgi:hypothetical protein